MRWPSRPAEPIEARIRVEPDGRVIALSGKVEYGQGIRTGFRRIVAEELGIAPERVEVVLGDTDRVPWDMGTFGSLSTAIEGQALRAAAAAVRAELLARASRRLGVPAGDLTTRDGEVRAGDGRAIGYGVLAAEAPLAGPVPVDVSLRPPSPADERPARIEARDIVTGAARYTSDLRLPGMVRGVVVHPPALGMRLASFDGAAARRVPGVVAVVHEGDFLAVVGDHVGAARAGAAALEATWEPAAPPPTERLDLALRQDPGVAESLGRAAVVHSATYSVPHVANAPIGPSAGVADVRDGSATVYAGTQRPFALREDLARMLGLPEQRVRVLPQVTSGSYGRNNIADAAIEAARLSRAVGRPVLVQWSRAEELAMAPARPVLVGRVEAGLSADGTMVAWRYHERTNPHTYGGSLPPEAAAQISGRNAVPPYAIPAVEVRLHVEGAQIRTAALRSLAAAPNVFAIESFVDELAARVGADPLDFRLRHVPDPRLRRVLEEAAERGRWRARPREPGLGHGLACAVYHGTYVAEVAEVRVSASGQVRLDRVWCALDCGRVDLPDGVRNQTEGAIQMAASWTLLEELRVAEGRVTTLSWDAYRIATCEDAPELIDVALLGEPGVPSTGAGEPGVVPLGAAIANAVFAACGARVRELPLRPARVRAARLVADGA
jgi:CO/xanthine dehydrogenase Mo-binding subunit